MSARGALAAAVTLAGLALAGAGWHEMRWRDPLDADLRTAAAVVTLAGATLAYAGLASALARRRGAVLCVSAYAALASALSCEIVLSRMDRSHAVGYTLAGQRWFRRHWRTNALGYRDRDHTPAELAAHKLVLVAGDSFAAGHGVDDERDAFPQRLGERLGPAWLALNLGVCGADTRTELSRLRTFPGHPHAIVLSYFGNDIVEAARAAGFPPPDFAPYAGVPPFALPWVERSYAVNWLFWSLPARDLDAWWAYLRAAYARPDLRDLHRRDLEEVAEHARWSHAPLVVVLWPYLHDLEASRAFAPWVADVCSALKVPVLDVAPLVAPLPPRARMVGLNDPHPSAQVHHLVADALYDLLRRENIVSDGVPSVE